MKSISKSAKVDTAFEAGAHIKKTKFEKFKMSCENIWVSTKQYAKVGTAVIGMGVIFAVASCGDAATTQGPQDSMVETKDVGENTKNDVGNNEKDGGVTDTGAVDNSWTKPDGYVDVCNSIGSSDKMKFLNHLCTMPLDGDNVIEAFFSNDGNAGMTTYFDGTHKFSVSHNFFSSSTYGNESLCTFGIVAAEMGYGDKGIFVPAADISGIDQYARIGCNIGPVGQHTTKTDVDEQVYTCSTVLVRVRLVLKTIYDDLYKTMVGE